MRFLARLFPYTRKLETEVARWMETGTQLQARHVSEMETAEEHAEALATELRTIADELFEERRKLAAEHTLRVSAEAVRDERDRELGRLRADKAEQIASLNEEIKSLRENNLGLLDRVMIKQQMVPVTESLKPEPLTAEEKEKRSQQVDSIRRTGPVAKSRQEAEAAYYAEQERIDLLRSKDADKPQAAAAGAE
jgi:hypothetical protein